MVRKAKVEVAERDDLAVAVLIALNYLPSREILEKEPRQIECFAKSR